MVRSIVSGATHPSVMALLISGWLLNKRRLNLTGESVTKLFLKENLTIGAVYFAFALRQNLQE